MTALTAPTPELPRRMSIFANATDTKSSKTLDIDALVQSIRSPSVGTITTIKEARAALAVEDEEKYDELKKTLSAITFSGVFKERKASGLKAHSGLMGLDFDGMKPDALESARAKLIGDPHIVFLYVSPSQEGLKGAVTLDSIPTDDAAHKVAFAAVQNYMEATHGLSVDKSCSDVCRLAFVSHDPACHHNQDAQPFIVEDWRDMTGEEKEVERLNQILARGHLASIKTPPPPCPLILSTESGKILGEAGNIVTLEGLMKSGKSGVLSAIIGGAVAPAGYEGDFLGFEIPTKDGYILHFDCEQSPKAHHRLIDNAVRKRAGLDEIPPFLISFSFLQAPVEDRWPACVLAAQRLPNDRPLNMVIFDGGADFLKILNDEELSREMVALMHSFAVERSCLVVIVIHENPNTEGGKTRGHFGSELWRKAQSAIGVSKGDDGVSSIFGKFLRDGDWPKSEAQHFRFCTEAGMHISADDPTEDRRASKTAAAEEAKREAQVALAKKIMSAPVMTYTALEAAVMKSEHIKDRAARDRIKALVDAGVVCKREDGHYELPK
jgi:VirE N-terminal domain